MHRDLTHYLDTLDTADTVGREYVAEAIYVARRDDPLDTPTPDDLRPILDDLPETLTADRARCLLAACLLRIAARQWDAGRHFRAARKATGESQREWGGRFDLSQSRISDYERGDRRPGEGMREKMREAADELEPDE